MNFARLLIQFFRILRQQQGALVQVEEAAQSDSTMKETEDKQVENEGADPDGAAPTPAIQKQWGLLASGKFFPTKNHGGKITPRYLVLHFTANASVSGTVKWFQKPTSEASAHIIVGRDGELVQMVPFHLRAWHAGESRWNEFVGLNEYSIGIELVNWGRLTYRKGKLNSWAQEVIDESDAALLADKDGKESWWQVFPDEQVEVCANVSRELVRVYELEDVLGHWQISPGRKSDPGPAFPLDDVRAFCYSDAPDWRAFVNAKNKDGK